MKQSKKIFAKYVSLNIMGMIALSCYILADTFFVANGIGPDGLTALNLAIPIYSFINGSGLMIGVGGSTKYSILKAEKKHMEANKAFTQTLYLGVVLSCVFLLIGFLFVEKLTLLLGADATVFDMTYTYIKIMLFFSPAFICNNIVICFVRNDGNPALSMLATSLGSFINIVLDYLFIFPCQMGILGAVVATGFAPIVGLLTSSRHFIVRKKTKTRDWTCVHPVKVAPSAAACINICSLGVSSLITELASGIVMIVFNLIILKLSGNVGVAAYGIIANLSLVVTSIFTGIAQGVQPIVSHAYGAGDTSTIRTYFRYAMTLSTALAIGIYLIVSFGHVPLIQAFNDTGNPELFQIAKTGIYLYFTAFIFVGMNIISASLFGAVNRPIPAFTLSIMRGFVVIIPVVFALSALLGMTGVWLSFPVTEAITGVVAGYLMWKLFT